MYGVMKPLCSAGCRRLAEGQFPDFPVAGNLRVVAVPRTAGEAGSWPRRKPAAGVLSGLTGQKSIFLDRRIFHEDI